MMQEIVKAGFCFHGEVHNLLGGLSEGAMSGLAIYVKKESLAENLLKYHVQNDEQHMFDTRGGK